MLPQANVLGLSDKFNEAQKDIQSRLGKAEIGIWVMAPLLAVAIITGFGCAWRMSSRLDETASNFAALSPKFGQMQQQMNYDISELVKKSEFTDWKDSLSTWKFQTTELADHAATKIEELTHQLNSLHGKFSKLHDDVSDLQEKVDRLTVTTDLGKVMNMYRDMDHKISAVQRDVASAMLEVTKGKDTIKRYGRDVAVMQTSVNELSALRDSVNKLQTVQADNIQSGLSSELVKRVDDTSKRLEDANQIAKQALSLGIVAKSVLHGVCFAKKVKRECPDGYEQKTLFHWYAPNGFDPFCDGNGDQYNNAEGRHTWDYMDGECQPDKSGNRLVGMFGCCAA